ncbi:MAG: LysR family transcriptional regulator [Mogibacterium sp.]|nr:LysR family transcriptional regulator [Mogibacterium sp.]
MTLRHLECALEVSRAGSINNAARKLLVSQPYLSGMINSLEKELGYPLFIRTNHGIKCTMQGEKFIKHAEIIMSEIDKIQSLGADDNMPCRIASYYSRFITQRYIEFHNKGNISGDRYREMGNMEVIEAVSRNDYSLGIIYHAKSKLAKFRRLADQNNLTYHTLFERMGTYLIMARNHPLANKEHITNEELRQCPIVFFDDESTMLYMLEHFRMPETTDAISVSDRGAFIDALLSGRYLSVINTPYPEDERTFLLKGISGCLPMDADIEVGSAYLTRADHKLTTREKEFLTHLTEEQDNYRKEPI